MFFGIKCPFPPLLLPLNFNSSLRKNFSEEKKEENKKDSNFLAKHLHQEIIANLESHIACLCRELMALIREDFAHDGSATVLF